MASPAVSSPVNRRRGTRSIAPLLVAAVTVLAPLSGAYAAGETPSAYINPDTGKASENSGVDAGSSCEAPDQSDTMPLGDEASGSGNLHVDACLFDGTTRVDTAAAFEVTGVGTVFACPDADKEGPKTATKTASSCLHSGFEAANSEYHVRVVSATAGLQTVTFCADPEGNGCSDATATSVVSITWGAPTGAVAAGGSPGLPLLPVGLGLLVLTAGVAATTVVFRARA